MVTASKAALGQPSRLYVEVTTRCNLRCPHCVKQAPGSGIGDEDMPLEVFSALVPAFPCLEALLLNGIGEPLLHPRLEEFVALARAAMPQGAWIGFQTNGQLLSTERAESLLRSGVSRVCVSVDGLEQTTLSAMRPGLTADAPGRALEAVRGARETVGAVCSLGVEFVVTADNLQELPAVVDWAGQRGADFALVSHIIPYAPEAAAKSLFNPNTNRSIALFERYRVRAEARGLDISGFFQRHWRYEKTEADKALAGLVREMAEEARREDVPLHLENLIAWSRRDSTAVERAFAEARAAARKWGMDLSLPALTAQYDRSCYFLEQGAAFITPDGAVRPCAYLWHRYACFLDGQTKFLEPKTFGNLREHRILDIWNSPTFAEFRAAVLRYDYPHCGNCSLVPCDNITGAWGAFDSDCYGVRVPCGHCVWCTGGVQCLG